MMTPDHPLRPAGYSDGPLCDDPACRLCWLWQRDGETEAAWRARITPRCRAEFAAAPYRFATGRPRPVHPETAPTATGGVR